MVTNPEVELAREFVLSTDCHIFLTGKAGTGKTTFLKQIQEVSPKRLIVTAPTGVAAINAGGVTLHSFFQIPFGPFVPGSEAYSHNSRNRFSREKQKIIKSLDLLIIDEISMVRADVLDAVEAVLRRYRRSNAPFGGVQLLMIGDLQQLTPVVKDSDRPILEQFYRTPYFFSSKGLDRTQLVTIELKHIYRQTDAHFIDLLNKVRDNRLDPAALEELNHRYDPEFLAAKSEGYITLCTHNRQADKINADRLGELPGKMHCFTAEIEGDFPEHSYPTAATLELKQDSQVMFLRNDPSPEKQFFNGKIGKITHISKEEIRVLCQGEQTPIGVKPSTWENIEYSLDEAKGAIEEKKIGAFIQYPLKTAWAITIHKSQGLTFDRAIIDAQAAFTHGQVYVALSRCRTLEGIVLNSLLADRSIQTDKTVLSFLAAARSDLEQYQLENERIRYQQRLLLECFDFKQLRFSLQKYISAVSRHWDLIQLAGAGDLQELAAGVQDQICAVGENFQRQLQGLFSAEALPSAIPIILERINKASIYFEEKLMTLVITPFGEIHQETDNKEIGKQINQGLQQVREEGEIKMAAVLSCREGFSPQEYLRALSAADLRLSQSKKEKKKRALYSEDDVAYPDFFEVLHQWRTAKAEEEKVAAFKVLHQKTLVQIAVHLPDTISQLKSIQGIGDTLARRYGEELVTMAARYRQEHGIATIVLPPLPSSSQQDQQGAGQKEGTKERTLFLLQQGLTLSEIGRKRSLALSTIEGHLAHWVAEGKVAIDRLITDERRQQIELAVALAIEQGEENSFSAIKNILGEAFSYGEIKLVIAHLKKTSG